MKPTNEQMLKMAFTVAGQIKAAAVLIHADILDNLYYKGRIHKRRDIYLLSRKKKLEANGNRESSLLNHCKGIITLPKTPLSRNAIIKFATTTALSLNFIQRGDKIVCVIGSSETEHLDQIQIIDTETETELVATKGMVGLTDNVLPEVFQSVLTLSIELAQKGREGKPVGTIFVVGDSEHVLPLTKQMIINPFKGYEEEDRNITHPAMKETIREFSAMDGAFVVSGDGIVLTAGSYLGAAVEESNLPRGLGSRHMAAAGITNLTKALAFVISESSGDLRIFKDGKVITTIEKMAK